MRPIARSIVIWFLIGIGVSAATSFILNKIFSVEHGVRVHTADQIWIEPNFDQALKHIWEKKITDPIDVESFVWVSPGEKRILFMKGPPRKIHIEGVLSEDLSKRLWSMTSKPLQPGLYNVLIRFPQIPPDSAQPDFFWSTSYIVSEKIKSERLFIKIQSNTVLYGLWIAKFFAILARVGVVLIFLIPLLLFVYNRIAPELQRPRLLFGSVLLLMLLLRFYGFTYQMEEGIHPDERAVEKIASYFRTGNLKPQNYFYTPSFHYMTAGIENLAAWILDRNLPDHAVPRFLSSLFSWLSCLVVFSIGNKLFSRTAAVIATILFGFAFLPVQIAHFGIIEPTMVFFFLLGFRFILNLEKEAGPKEYIKAGLAAGLAVGIKQTAALICIPFFLKYLFEYRFQSFRLNTMKKSLWWIVGAVATYLLLSPFTILDLRHFLHDQFFQLRFLSGGTRTSLYFIEDPSGTSKILEYLEEGIGYPVLICAAIGCLLVWKYSRSGFITIVPITLLFFGIASMVRAAPYHYPLLLFPFVALLASVTVSEITTRLRFHPIFIACLIAALLGFPLFRIFKMEKILTGVDTRRKSSEWCYKNLPLGARIDYEQFGPRFLIPVFRSLMIPLWTRNTWDQYMKIRIPEYVVIDSTTANIFLRKSREVLPEEHEWFASLRKNGEIVQEFKGTSLGQYNPHIIIYKIPKEDAEPSK